MAGYIGSKAVLLSTTAAVVTGDMTVAGAATFATVDGPIGSVTPASGTFTSVTTSGQIRLNDSNYWIDNSGGSDISYRSGGTHLFYSGGFNERMRIDGSGNVGIGTLTTALTERLAVTESGISNPAVIRLVGTNSDGSASCVSAIGSQQGSGGTGSGDLTFSTRSAGGAFATPTERMRIDSGGNLLVGTTSIPNLGTAHVIVGASSTSGLAPVLIQNTTGTANCPVVNLTSADASTDSSNRFMQFYAAYSGGTSTAMGGIVGNGAGNVAFATLSDAREKQNITPVVSAADKIAQIEVVAFDFIKSKEHVKYGFIAQNVLSVFPEFVVSNMSNEGEEERLGLTGGMSSGYIAVLTAALQEALTEIAALKVRVAALEVTP